MSDKVSMDGSTAATNDSSVDGVDADGEMANGGSDRDLCHVTQWVQTASVSTAENFSAAEANRLTSLAMPAGRAKAKAMAPPPKRPTTPDFSVRTACKGTAPVHASEIPHAKLEDSEEFPFILGPVSSPTLFYIHAAGGERQFEELEALVAALDRAVKDLAETGKRADSETLKPGTMLVVKDSKSGELHRAEFLRRVDDERIEVFFVDYGLKDVVVAADSWLLPVVFIKQPRFAIRCSLPDIGLPNDRTVFPEAANEVRTCRIMYILLRNFVFPQVMMAFCEESDCKAILRQQKNEVSFVEIFDRAGLKSLAVTLCEKGLARNTAQKSKQLGRNCDECRYYVQVLSFYPTF